MKNSTNTKEYRKFALLLCLFVFLALLYYFVNLGQFSWDLLLLGAIGWFFLESRSDRKRFRNAISIGLFLLVFDFIFENSGWLLGLWHTTSYFHLGVVPIEVMGIAFFGGTAWATYMPKKFDQWFSFYNCLVFGFFGALGEWLLIHQGLFVYNPVWTSVDAFIAYFLTWVILVFLRYRVVKD